VVETWAEAGMDAMVGVDWVRNRVEAPGWLGVGTAEVLLNKVKLAPLEEGGRAAREA